MNASQVEADKNDRTMGERMLPKVGSEVIVDLLLKVDHAVGVEATKKNEAIVVPQRATYTDLNKGFPF